ncbi:MAG: peptidoglycan editing factor PgeF [Acidobacteria bacterium]|nr:peptidoglycan editing factor PgeF [Acidobacteriota bacterium]
MDHFSFRKHRGLQLLVCDPMEKIGFINAFSTRSGGLSPLPANALSLGNFRQDERENVIENRRRFLDALGASDWQLVTAKQIHSAVVRPVLDAEDAQTEPTACDALTAKTEGILLAVQTADCLPVLIADERNRAFAAVHAGWRGTLAGIVAHTVEQMQMGYDSRAEDLRAAFGPVIRSCCFEVGPEVLAQFRDSYTYAEELISRRQEDGKAYLDLIYANRRQLLDCGVQAERIYDCGLCTVCRNDLFFSYRRENGAENPVGRLMGVIGTNYRIRLECKS